MKLNGKEKFLSAETTLSNLLHELGYQSAYVAVEKNGEIIPREIFPHEIITNKDKLEVVSFVGGG